MKEKVFMLNEPLATAIPSTEEARAILEDRLVRIIQADPLELYWQDDDGHWHLRRPDELSRNMRMVVKSVHRTKYGTTYYELFDKDKAINLLCKLKGWYNKKSRVSVTPLHTSRVGDEISILFGT